MIVSDTIIAQCTPTGSGAIALLRISGPQALAIATAIARLGNNKNINQLPTHTVHYGAIVDAQGATIDQCLFVIMHGPRTFTGQDTVEITCHNNPFIIQAIIATALHAGARMAHEGEFTRRAVLNNKIDLLQAEAIHELIQANSSLALKQSLAQVQGSFSASIADIEKMLIKALAFCDASFEFIDEEMEFGDFITQMLNDILLCIAQMKKSFNQQQQIRQGFRVAIIGAVNAGKSSLFNALLHKQRAIVTNIAGTTRDTLEAGLYKNGNYWTLVDTAGLRQTEDIIEQEGIARSLQEIALADVVLLVIDQARMMTPHEEEIYGRIIRDNADKVLLIYNKSDQPISIEAQFCAIQPLLISTKTAHNIELLEQRIQEKINLLIAACDSPFLLNKRQYNILIGVEQQLAQIQEMLHGTVEYELISYQLKEALTQLTQLTGKTISEQGMDAIFREFCVGK